MFLEISFKEIIKVQTLSFDYFQILQKHSKYFDFFTTIFIQTLLIFFSETQLSKSFWFTPLFLGNLKFLQYFRLQVQKVDTNLKTLKAFRVLNSIFLSKWHVSRNRASRFGEIRFVDLVILHFYQFWLRRLWNVVVQLSQKHFSWIGCQF